MSETGAIFSLFGVPSSIGTNSSTSQSSDSNLAPEAIRRAYARLFGGYNIPKHFRDCGDVSTFPGQSTEELLAGVEEAVYTTLSSGKKVALLGGSHTLTLGSLRAVHKARGDFSLIYFDAHPDLMPDERIYFGSTLYHATLQERVLNAPNIGYVGIRQIEEEEQDFITKNHPVVVSPSEVLNKGAIECARELLNRLPPPYYLSIDLDGIDPSAAPGVTTPFPFGLYPRELLEIAKVFCGKDLLGIEIVEHSPSRDIGEITVFLAAALLQELTDFTTKRLAS